MLKYNITTNKVAKFRILYISEDFELKYTLKMTESVGSTNILYRFMNTSVRYVHYKVIPSKCKRPYLCKKNCFKLVCKKLLGLTRANFRLQDNCQKSLLTTIFVLTDNKNVL